MARLAVCAFGMAFGAPVDQTGFVQITKSIEEASFDGVTKSKLAAGYAPEEYKEGQLIEYLPPSGTWVAAAVQNSQPGDTWHIKLPGADLEGVPARLLRRRLDEGESDWLVLPTAAKGKGLYYRRSKNLPDVVGTDYAPSNSHVLARGGADGWVQTKKGYLPIHLLDNQVLAKRDRKHMVAISEDFRDWYVEAEDARRRAIMAKAPFLPLPPTQTYAENEEALYQISDGEWCPAKVVSSSITTFAVLVRPVGGSEYTVPRAKPYQLRKAGPPKHEPVEGESPACQSQGGCIEVQVNVEPSCQSDGGCTAGEDHTVQAAMGEPIRKLVETVCEAINGPYSCDTRLELRQRGKALPTWWRTFEAGLKNGAVVSATLAPITVTSVTDVSR